MNIRDLINRIESIELNEGLRLKDIEAQVANEPNEQKRAQTLMTLAQTNKLPGLYDPVSGYFVSAEPDTQGEWQGAGTPTKPRISATGTEDQDALLSKRGLVPPKANTSTFLRHLNPFSSSNKDYDAGVQSGSQAAIARQNKEDEELKQLTDLIPKYKALKAKLSALTGQGPNTDARTGQGIVPADMPLAEALLESFSYLFDDVTGAGRAAGEMLPKIWNKLPAVVRGGEKTAGNDWEVLDRLPNQVSTELRRPPRPDISDAEWRTVPDKMKAGVGAWLKANPGKSVAAAMAVTALAANQIGGGQGNRGVEKGPDRIATAPAPSSAGAGQGNRGVGQGDVGGDQTTNPNAAAKTNSSTPYKINRGDTLSRIAQQNGVSVAELMAANPAIINPNNINAGQTITIPPASGKPVYDQGVGSKPTTMPYDAPNPPKTDSDADAEAETAAKKAEIEATQKEIDTAKKQLADLIVDLEKSEDEDNIRQLKDLEAQLDDLDDIKALNANDPSASNYTNQMDRASDAANAKKDQANDPSSANYTNQMDRASDAASVSDKAPPKFTPKDATTPVAGDKEGAVTDYSIASAPNAKGAKLNAMKESDDELARWLRIANIK